MLYKNIDKNYPEWQGVVFKLTEKINNRYYGKIVSIPKETYINNDYVIGDSVMFFEKSLFKLNTKSYLPS